MTRQSFIQNLDFALYALAPEERLEAVRFYNEYLDEAEDEAAALAALGSPADVANRIKEEFKLSDPQACETSPNPRKASNLETCETSQNRRPHSNLENIPLPPFAYERKSPNVGKIVGISFLVLCASPLLAVFGSVGIAILAAIFSVVLTLYVCLFGVALGLVGSGLGIMFGSIFGITEGLGAVPAFFLGVLILGLGLLTTAGFLAVTRYTIPPLCRSIWRGCTAPFRAWKAKRAIKQEIVKAGESR